MAQGDDSRRDALKHLVVLGGAALACAVAAPAAVFVAGPARAGGAMGERWIRTLPLDALREGVPKKVAVVADDRDAWTLARDVTLGSAWLVRRGDAVVAFSATCPHLGCSVDLKDEGFACPCHDSSFAADGACTAGPSPRGLDPLPTRLTGGFVEVDFKRFKIGGATREVVG